MCVGQEKLKNRCIQLAKKTIEEAFPNILTFTTHFTIKISNIFVLSLLCTYQFFSLLLPLPSLSYFYLPFSTSTPSILPLPDPFLPPTSLLSPPPSLRGKFLKGKEKLQFQQVFLEIFGLLKPEVMWKMCIFLCSY